MTYSTCYEFPIPDGLVLFIGADGHDSWFMDQVGLTDSRPDGWRPE